MQGISLRDVAITNRVTYIGYSVTACQIRSVIRFSYARIYFSNILPVEVVQNQNGIKLTHIGELPLGYNPFCIINTGHVCFMFFYLGLQSFVASIKVPYLVMYLMCCILVYCYDCL